MDSLTHGLLGVAIGALRRPDGGPSAARPASATDRAVFWMTLAAAELPDIDVLLMSGGPLNHIRYHRGYTHSIPFAFAIAAALAWLATRIWKGARFSAVFGWSLASVLVGHLLADWITGFGTRMLLPFSNSHLALDWVALYEPLMTLPLLLAVLAARRWPQRRRELLGTGLILTALFVGYRGWAHHQTVRQVQAYYAARDPGQPLSITVHPTVWRLTSYEYVVETPRQFRLGSSRLGAQPMEYAVYDKPADDPVLTAAEADPRVQDILHFARHALLMHREENGRIMLLISDFRGGYAFNFRAILDQHHRVLEAFRDYSPAYPKG